MANRRLWTVCSAAVVLMTGLLSGEAARAVGGGSLEVADGGYAFTVKLDSESRSCSGALITAAWVITTKSCFPENTAPGSPATPTRATIGRTSLSATTGHVVDIAHVVPHPDHDVALARLAQAVTDVAPVAISGSAPAAGDTLRITGYGRTATEWIPDRMHVGAFAVQGSAPTTMDVEPVSPDNATVCKGDAGGPAFREVGGNIELVGLNSVAWQGGCLGETETRRGAVEARLDNIVDWIIGTELDLVAQPSANSVKLSWKLPGYPVSTFTVYGSTTPDAPIGTGTRLGDAGRATTFVHQGLRPKQTWYYRVVPVNAGGQNGPSSTVASATPTGSLTSDFNGDGKSDIATFLNDASGDVYVSRSTGSSFLQDNQRWHEFFAPNGEYPLSGDFNGDGRDDIVTFTRGTTGDVYVALSDGTKFVGTGQKWNDNFAPGDQIPAVGDFNGDGRDDIVTFTRGTTGDVYVSLSDGSKFVQVGWKWNDNFAVGDQIPAVGDFNGDGRDDIVTFTRGTTGDVYVSLSDGSKFVQVGWKWNDNFAPGDQVPGVGDFNGDGKDDIVTFTRGTTGDVYASLSDGTRFVEIGQKWNDNFAPGEQVPGIGDLDGDGKDDIITYTRGTTADVYASLSDGTRFVQIGQKWHDNFAPGTQVPQPRLIS